MANLRQYELDESIRLRRIIEQMNVAHAEMGGRDCRPARVALVRCMRLLDAAIAHEQAALPPKNGMGRACP